MFGPSLKEVASPLFDAPPTVESSGRRLRGTRDGRPMSFWFLRADASPGSDVSTRIDLERPTEGIVLELSRQHASLRHAIARGEYVDVEIGDAPFDGAFLLEGAPARRVKALLSSAPRLRQRLRDLPSLQALSIHEAGVGLRLRGWPNGDLAAAIEILDDTVGALEEAERAPSAGGYRQAATLAEPGDEEEIEALRATRAQRFAARERMGCYFVLSLLAALAVFLVWVFFRT